MNQDKTIIAKESVLEQLFIVIIIYAGMILLHLKFTDFDLTAILRSALASFIMVSIAIILKSLVKKPDLPGFAWGTLVSFALTLPISPVQSLILESMKASSFSLVGLPLLAFAGISVGDQLGLLKKLSWKIVIISLLVMASTYFGSALISNIVLKLTNMI